MVDDALAGVFAHGTAAQRVNGDKIVVQDLGPGGVGNYVSTQGLRGAGELAAHFFKNVLFAHALPVDIDFIVATEPDDTVAVVVRHDQVYLRVIYRAFEGSAED